MRRLLILFVGLWMALCANAQTLSVTSFKAMPMDMDARVNHPVTDHNGKKCAIIKVENSNTGFAFDTGTLQVQKVEQQPGEIWVYVQPGVRKMTIRHQSLGILREYIFPEPIKEGTVYVMKLESGKGTTSDANIQQTGYLIIESNPTDAEVWIDDEWLGNTTFTKKYPIGTKLQYRIKKQLYHDEVGTVTVTQTQTRLTPSLKPAFGSLQINSTPSGAVVYMDDAVQSVGKTPLHLSQVSSGSHTIRLQMPMYVGASREAVIADGETTTVALQLSANFATLTIVSLPDATIEVDGKVVGTGRAVVKQSEGVCDIVVKKKSHRDERRQITVTAGNDQTIELNPTPVYGTLAVESDPIGATIYVNGKEYGTTPNIISNLLVGDYTVRLSKSGCADYTQEVSVVENEEKLCRATLPTGKQVTISTSQAGDDVYVDGVRKGTSPLTITLPFGTHRVYAMRQGKKSQEKVVEVSQYLTGNNVTLSFGTQTFTVNGVSFTMVRVDGGTFTMGATPEQGSDAYGSEKPAHRVTLSSYLIGQTEVTQSLWKAVMGENPSYFKGDNLPVENVSWKDCQTFISKLNQLTGKTFRLPTEAEWEYAARGGNKSKGYKYSGSSDIGSVAWYENNSSRKTHPVGAKQPNELGIYDMSGNVWEWCSDYYDSYSSAAVTNPTGPVSGSYRVGRGGSWDHGARRCRVSNRDCDFPDYSHPGLGLRLVVVP